MFLYSNIRETAAHFSALWTLVFFFSLFNRIRRQWLEVSCNRFIIAQHWVPRWGETVCMPLLIFERLLLTYRSVTCWWMQPVFVLLSFSDLIFQGYRLVETLLPLMFGPIKEVNSKKPPQVNVLSCQQLYKVIRVIRCSPPTASVQEWQWGV